MPQRIPMIDLSTCLCLAGLGGLGQPVTRGLNPRQIFGRVHGHCRDGVPPPGLQELSFFHDEASYALERF